MSGQRRHEGNYDSHSGFSATVKEQYRLWFPRSQTDSRHNKAPVETAEQKHSTRRNGNSRPDLNYPAGSSYNIPPSTSTRKPTQSSTRPPSRYVSNYPSQPTNATVPPSSVAYPQNQTRPQPQGSQPDIPEMHDLRSHLKKRTPAAPTPKSSYEQISGHEDATKGSRHPRPRNNSKPYPPAQPQAPSVWNPSMQHPSDYSRGRAGVDTEKHRTERLPDRPEKSREIEGDRSDRRHREKERAAERDRRENDKIKETERAVERDRMKENERAREKIRTKEREKYSERLEETDGERRLQGEHRRTSKPPLPSRDRLDQRLDDYDSSDSFRPAHAVSSSNHRRYRSEEVPQST